MYFLLRLAAVASAANKGIKKKIHGSGTTTVARSSERLKDVMKINLLKI